MNHPRHLPWLILSGITILTGCAFFVNPAAPGGTGGELRGRVRIIGRRPDPTLPLALPFRLDRGIFPPPAPIPDERLEISPNGGVRNAVIWIVGEFDVADDNPPSIVLGIHNSRFVPHVLPAPVGGSLRVANQDKVFHNANFEAFKSPSYNRSIESGEKILLVPRFEAPECMMIDCRIHPWEHAWIVACQNPHFTVTDLNGDFRISGIPPGKYPVRIWHPHARPADEHDGVRMKFEVEIRKGETAVLNVDMQAR